MGSQSFQYIGKDGGFIGLVRWQEPGALLATLAVRFHIDIITVAQLYYFDSQIMSLF